MGTFWLYRGGREVAWRVLDSQYFGIPQRRKRVFVVASARKDAAPKILFDKIERSKPCEKSGKIEENVVTNSSEKSDRKTFEGLTIHCMTGFGSAFRETYPFPTLCTKGWGELPLVESDDWVRYLSPIECERLQGFPDDYTKIPFNGKSADECKDSPRYKAIGNSMTVNVMRYLGERISKFM